MRRGLPETPPPLREGAGEGEEPVLAQTPPPKPLPQGEGELLSDQTRDCRAAIGRLRPTPYEHSHPQCLTRDFNMWTATPALSSTSLSTR
jgi:hypothetical protein